MSVLKSTFAVIELLVEFIVSIIHSSIVSQHSLCKWTDMNYRYDGGKTAKWPPTGQLIHGNVSWMPLDGYPLSCLTPYILCWHSVCERRLTPLGDLLARPATSKSRCDQNNAVLIWIPIALEMMPSHHLKHWPIDCTWCVHISQKLIHDLLILKYVDIFQPNLRECMLFPCSFNQIKNGEAYLWPPVYNPNLYLDMFTTVPLKMLHFCKYNSFLCWNLAGIFAY